VSAPDPAAPPHADRELVAAVLRAAPGAFERLVRQYQGLCWHIVYRLVRDPEEARDLCQEVFFRVHLNLRQYRGDSALRHWIGRVAYSIALRHLKRRRADLGEALSADAAALAETLEDPAPDLALACADEDRVRRLHAAIETLAPLPRLLLTLFHLDDMPIPEIARTTGLPSGTIKSHLFRARQRLRELLHAPLTELPSA
jgi:RNA polymerase sigma-70 factor (ECF subfamily)